VKALLSNLTEAEKALVRETERDRMAALDEDELVELHRRIRRARNKFVGMYRREASAKVAAKGGRGAARPKNRRNAGKAEIFEDALARVSRRLSVVAKQSAADLKAERLAAARADAQAARAAKAAGKAKAGVKGSGGGASGKATGKPSGKVAGKSAGRLKREASSLAAGARRQAKRDSR
jgi:hypothetical protein